MYVLDKIIVLDNVVSETYQTFLENEFTGAMIPWYFKKDASYNIGNNQYQDKAAQTTPACGNMFFNIDQGGIITAGLHFLTLPLAFEAFNKANIKPGYLLRSRSFLYFPLSEKVRREHDNPHVDSDVSHLVCLYYVNDSDGDTFIFDKTVNDVHPERDSFNGVEFNVVQRVTPKKGRAVIFDGTTYHASSCPSKDIRCIINFNFTHNQSDAG